MTNVKRPGVQPVLTALIVSVFLIGHTAVAAQKDPPRAKDSDWVVSEQGNLEWKHLTGTTLADKVRDVTVSEDGGLIFALTRKEVVVFSVEDRKILDRIALTRRFERIVFARPDKLILASAKGALLETIQYRRIYDIDITGRPFEGPADAEVTIVVFDDYQ